MTNPDSDRRIGLGLIGLGVGCVAVSLLTDFYDSHRFILASYVLQIFDLSAIGIVYLLFGSSIAGYARLTDAESMPFGVSVITAVVAVLALFVVGLFTPYVGGPSGGYETASEVAETVLFFPQLQIGCYLALLFTCRFAADRHQYLLSIAGIIGFFTLVVAAAVGTALESAGAGGTGAGWGIWLGQIAVVFSAFYIFVAAVCMTPFYLLRSAFDGS